jgi:hypothetical protein
MAQSAAHGDFTVALALYGVLVGNIQWTYGRNISQMLSACAHSPAVIRSRSGIFTPLNLEPIEHTTFAPPNPAQTGDATGGLLLYEAARLSLRAGAAPFRSLAHISVAPRPYQFVPLIMALRMETVRLLIADDVGVHGAPFSPSSSGSGGVSIEADICSSRPSSGGSGASGQGLRPFTSHVEPEEHHRVHSGRPLQLQCTGPRGAASRERGWALSRHCAGRARRDDGTARGARPPAIEPRRRLNGYLSPRARRARAGGG